MTEIDVECGRDDGGDRWICAVVIRDGGRRLGTHRVGVAPAVLERLAPAATDPTALVRESFRFLLEREPPSSILASFDLELIGDYFPEYEVDIRRRMPAPG